MKSLLRQEETFTGRESHRPLEDTHVLTQDNRRLQDAIDRRLTSRDSPPLPVYPVLCCFGDTISFSRMLPLQRKLPDLQDTKPTPTHTTPNQLANEYSYENPHGRAGARHPKVEGKTRAGESPGAKSLLNLTTVRTKEPLALMNPVFHQPLGLTTITVFPPSQHSDTSRTGTAVQTCRTNKRQGRSTHPWGTPRQPSDWSEISAS